MKSIINDYIYLRMTFLLFIITFCSFSFVQSGFNLIWFMLGLGNVAYAFYMAIKIADFEMSDIGKVVSLWESDKVGHLDVYIKR